MNNYKQCNNCMHSLPILEFSVVKNRKGELRPSQYCKKCKCLQASLKKRDLKRKCIEYKGGKCVSCGLVSEHTTIYDFHHKDPSQKDFSVSHYTDKKSKGGILDDILKAELDKCLLLCANCHRIEHDTLHGQQWTRSMPTKKLYTCSTCNKPKSTKLTNRCFACSKKKTI